MAKRSVLKLDMVPIAFTLIGISSHENDYRLSWNINEQLGLHFVQTSNLKTDTGEEFACFIHDQDDQVLLLISNRCDNGFMFKKYKNLDFILKFGSELADTELATWLHNLKKVPLISAVVPIPFNKNMLSLLG